MDGTPQHARSAWCDVYRSFFRGIPIHRQIVTVITYHLDLSKLFKTLYKCLKFTLTLTLLTLLLLTLLKMYFRFGGWRYTLFVLINQSKSLFHAEIKWSLDDSNAAMTDNDVFFIPQTSGWMNLDQELILRRFFYFSGIKYPNSLYICLPRFPLFL